MYYALYRKYRPKDFDSVVGQNAIVKTLKNSIILNNFSHAYLFYGPRGTGKTTLSKIFARNINCLSPNNGLSCGKCDACISSFSNNCVDIIEIDAASNNGVDEIRELKSNVNLVPSTLKYKVYIIDEVHMLSTGAFNALLKTLEEPPSHVIFILATTDPQKVPETIVSRCQSFAFRRISDEEIASRLEYVCDEEKVEIDKSVIKKIAFLSEGGLRDALGMLDTVMSYSGNKITLDDFNDICGIVSDTDINFFINNIMCGDIYKVLNDINKFCSNGKNMIQIIVQTINYLRDIIVEYYIDNTELEYNVDLYEKLIFELNDKLPNIKKSGNSKIYIEMLILKFINANISFLSSSELNINNMDMNFSKNEQDELNNNDFVENVAIGEVNNVKNNSYEEDSHNIPSKILNISEIMNIRVNNTMATADKSLLQREKNNYEMLKEYSFDQQIGAVVNSLLDAKLRACGKNNLIISYNSAAVAQQNIENILNLDKVYNKITKSGKQLAIITDSDWEKVKFEYISRIKEKRDYSIIEEPEFVFEDIKKDDIITSSAVDLFGSDIVEFE